MYINLQNNNVSSFRLLVAKGRYEAPILSDHFQLHLEKAGLLEFDSKLVFRSMIKNHIVLFDTSPSRSFQEQDLRRGGLKTWPVSCGVFRDLERHP
jgi:hypothetical protein